MIQAAELKLNRKADPFKTIDMVEIMEWVARYHFRRANECIAQAERVAKAELTSLNQRETEEGKELTTELDIDDGLAIPYLDKALTAASEVANYKHPRLASVKVAEERREIGDDLTALEAAERLLRLMELTRKVPRMLTVKAVSTGESVGIAPAE